MMENIVGVVLIFTVPVWALLGWVVHKVIDLPRLIAFLNAFQQKNMEHWVTTEKKQRKELKKKKVLDTKGLL